MTARWITFGLWAAVAASALYWGLRLFAPSEPVPDHALVVAGSTPPRGDLTRLFGVEPVAPVAAAAPESSRFQLLGVVAPRSPAAATQGVALIAVDGKPPRAYRVGAVVDGSTVLQAVRQRGVSLGPRDGDARVSLDIPPPMPAAVGSLPRAGAGPAARPMLPARPMPPPFNARPAAPPPPPPTGTEPQIEPDAPAGDSGLQTE